MLRTILPVVIPLLVVPIPVTRPIPLLGVIRPRPICNGGTGVGLVALRSPCRLLVVVLLIAGILLMGMRPMARGVGWLTIRCAWRVPLHVG